MNMQNDNQEINNFAWRIVNCIAATIAGEKPATVINFSNDNKGFLDLWNKFGKDLFNGGRIEYYELKRKDKNAIVLFFCQHKLNGLLRKKQIKEFLVSLGYKVEQPLEDILSLLKERFNSYSFPHEIGIFLGIPLKDVKAFMGLISLPCTQVNRWKIYGNPNASLRVIKKYRQAEEKIRKIFLREN